MKLYTEEQVKIAIDLAQEQHKVPYTEYDYVHTHNEQKIIQSLTPIELPSDEEIEELATDGRDNYSDYNNGFINGAKWMREQILGKEDNTFKQKSKWTEVDNMTRRLK